MCILTAADDRQAEMYRKQLAWRRESSLLPAGTEFVVLPDAPGTSIGSGGATLAALQLQTERNPYPAARRTLVIHSGGDARPLPHCSAQGKLFARIPRTLPDGRASTVFDEFLISLSGLAPVLPPGALVTSGDVLLLFDHLQLSFRRQGATGVATSAPQQLAQDHGVFVSEPGSGRLAAYLRKPRPEELANWNAVKNGYAQIDTGMVWFDEELVRRLVALASMLAHPPAPLNLYGDLLPPLAASTDQEAYLAGAREAAPSSEMRAAREVIWSWLRGTPFAVEIVQPAVFVHLHGSRDYWEMAANDTALAGLCAWEQHPASWLSGATGSTSDRLIAINAAVEGEARVGPEPLLVSDCRLAGALSWTGPGLLSGVDSTQPIELLPNIALDQLPVGESGIATRCFGLRDDPRRTILDPQASFCNLPWPQWLAAVGVAPSAIWGDRPEGERTLWNARLFPVLADREESLRLALPLQEPHRVPVGWRERWLASPRCSFAESVSAADAARLIAELVAREDYIAARRFLAAVASEEPAARAKKILGSAESARARRAGIVAGWLAQADPLLRIRGYRALFEGTGVLAWEESAFDVLASMIERAVPRLAANHAPYVAREGTPVRTARAAAGARIDFGGGWTDTPPHSIERGGAVLNAAITLNGVHPIEAEATFLDRPCLLLESRDLDMTVQLSRAGEVLAYANPSDPFALHKAALVLRGVVPAGCDPDLPISELLASTGGIQLSTATRIPFGSGLGTSSILAGTVLAALSVLMGAGKPPDAQLFDEVLSLEQMLTTGGGWQDQVGGLTGGIKLVTSEPGLPQRITVGPLTLAAATERELASRLCLVYTGQQRLAKNLLRSVMSRWMSREPEMVWLQNEIARLAFAMRAALESGDVDGFGALLGDHWQLNRRMDPGCANPFIDGLFDAMAPYISGGKLAGAGGGGFAIVVTRTPEYRARLTALLAEGYPATGAGVWPWGISAEGLRVEAS